MTDKELIQAMRCCGANEEFGECGHCPAADYGCTDAFLDAADRLEALISENESLVGQLARRNDELLKLREQVPKWVSVKERLPHFNQPYIVTACDENAPAGEGIWYSTVVVVAEYYDGCWTWYEGSTEYDLNEIVTHWMPLPEPPSIEGSPTGQKG